MQENLTDSSSGHQPESQPEPAQDASPSQMPTDAETAASQRDTVRAIAQHVIKKLYERHAQPPH